MPDAAPAAHALPDAAPEAAGLAPPCAQPPSTSAPTINDVSVRPARPIIRSSPPSDTASEHDRANPSGGRVACRRHHRLRHPPRWSRRVDGGVVAGSRRCVRLESPPCEGLPSALMFERTKLPDGPRVISARLPSSRSVSMAAYVLAGSRLETDGEAGVAHFMEHLTFKGTSGYPSSRAISEAVEGVGGSVERRDRPRVDGVLGARAAARGGDRDERPGRAHRPPAPR